MNTNIESHYKDRSPIETIQIITQFFNDRQIQIRKKNEIESEINTYSCTYSLWWHGHQLFSCNGKGMTPLYSQASCFGELYERFCYFSIVSGHNVFLKNDVMNLRKQKFGYNLYPNEKELDVYSYFNTPCIRDSNIFDFICNAQTNSQQFAHIYSNDKLLGCPYKSLINNSIQYQDIMKITQELGTTGLATGNTLEEALVQGSSELFERITVEKFFYNVQDKYYTINIQNLDKIYQDKIQILNELNYQVYLYDLSYNFELPVILLIVYNPIYQTCFMKFGSHPIFDIALERCFTELYQGYSILPDDLNSIELDWYILEDSFKYIKNINTGLLANHNQIVVPQFIFNNTAIQVDSFNSKYFLYSKSYSNSDLLCQIKEIIKLNHFQFDYLDISKSNNIFAIHIIPRQQLLSCRSKYNKFDIEKIEFTKEQQYNFMLVYEFIYDQLNQLKQKEISYDPTKITTAINFILNTLSRNIDDIVSTLPYMNILLTNSIYNPFNLKGDGKILEGYHNLLYLIIDDFQDIFFPVRDERKKLWEQYKLYEVLKNQNYNNQNIYDNLKLKNLNFEENESTLNIYLIYLLYIYNFQNIYTSEEYKEFINMLIS